MHGNRRFDLKLRQTATVEDVDFVTPRVQVKNEVVRVAIPPGSIFKGHEPFLVQDLVTSAKATCYLRERWITPDGRTVLAPLPQGVDGHFGVPPGVGELASTMEIQPDPTDGHVPIESSATA